MGRPEPPDLVNDLVRPPELAGGGGAAGARRGLGRAAPDSVARRLTVHRGVQADDEVGPAGDPAVEEPLAVVHAEVRLRLARGAQPPGLSNAPVLHDGDPRRHPWLLTDPFMLSTLFGVTARIQRSRAAVGSEARGGVGKMI